MRENKENIKDKPDKPDKPEKYSDAETKKEGSSVETIYKYNDARYIKINE